MSDYTDVGDFHRRFGLDTSDRGKAGPRPHDPELIKFRVDFMQEELDEFKKACEEGDVVGQVDALMDLAYVVYGTAHMMGFFWPAHWGEVHGANMEKVRASEGHVGPRGNTQWDVIKPPNWNPPRHEPHLRAYGWDV